MALASCLALSGVSLPAEAAGLGKLLVFSALGQPLRAEIEVTATREELPGMTARLAPKEAFQRVGLDYLASLQNLHFIIEQRDNEQVVIKLLSTVPINDPFLDLLLELDWPTGRFVREVTLLLDPPEALANSVPLSGLAVVKLPELPAAAAAAGRSEEAPLAAVSEEASEEKLALRARAREALAREGEPATELREFREVKRGDTLSKIARSIKPEGVSLEQMLVSLFRANQEAFDGANMNRLRAGKLLVIPRPAALETIPPAAAKKLVEAQSADWNSYRKKLAAMVVQVPGKDAGGKQEDAGKITARVAEKEMASVTPRDQVKVSATDLEGMKPGAAAKVSEEDLVAKEKALKEANERLIMLEKNVASLQKLLELKSLRLADKLPLGAEKATPVRVRKAQEPPKAKKKQNPHPV
jgi:pilus assembly protein FimV